MKRVDPIGRGPSFVYGASLTTLPTLYSETVDGYLPCKLTATMRAIRFGGFRAGGYANETSQVVMLTVKQDANKVRKRQRRGKKDFQRNDYNESDEERWSTWEWHWNQPWEVGWSNITTTGIVPGDNDEENSFERDFLSRAYHTSTLLLDRYLVVIGGMKGTCILFTGLLLGFYRTRRIRYVRKRSYPVLFIAYFWNSPFNALSILHCGIRVVQRRVLS
jgi:hypothetical protein